MHLDLCCVDSFLVLVEEAHFGRAAERLHLTPSALTKRMQRLERQVGIPLLARDSTGVAGLTAAGRRFLSEADPLLAASRAALAAARGDGGPLTLRLGVVGAVGEFPDREQLAEVGRQMGQRHPEVRIVCTPVPVVAVNSCLLEGLVDVMWGTAPIAPPGIDTCPLVELERFGVVPVGHPLADAGQVHAADFAELPLLQDPAVPSEWLAPLLLADLRTVKEARLVTIQAATARGVFARVAQGQGVTTTAWLASELGPRLRAVRLLGLPAAPFHAARRRSDRRAAVLSLLDVLPRVAARARADTAAHGNGFPSPGTDGSAGRAR